MFSGTPKLHPLVFRVFFAVGRIHDPRVSEKQKSIPLLICANSVCLTTCLNHAMCAPGTVNLHMPDHIVYKLADARPASSNRNCIFVAVSRRTVCHRQNDDFIQVSLVSQSTFIISAKRLHPDGRIIFQCQMVASRQSA